MHAPIFSFWKLMGHFIAINLTLEEIVATHKLPFFVCVLQSKAAPTQSGRTIRTIIGNFYPSTAAVKLLRRCFA